MAVNPRCIVYTPDPLASGIANALKRSQDDKWLEPSCGNGAFLRAIGELGVDSSRVVAVDLDTGKHPSDSLAATLRGTDFLAWANCTEERFDRIVGNPPYVPARFLHSSLRDGVAGIRDLDGNSIRRNANYWYAFVCAAIRLLRTDGAVGMVLPASFEFADYAEPLRRALPRLFDRVTILRSAAPLCENVLDGNVVLIATGYGKGPAEVFRSDEPDLYAVVAALKIDVARSISHEPSEVTGAESVQMGSVASIRIGAVTGDAGYFLFTDKERRRLELSTKTCRPVLTRSRHLAAAYIDKHVFVDLKDAGERVWLFRPTAGKIEDPAVADYLDWGRREGGCDVGSYKVRSRHIWYHVPLPPRPHGFISGSTDKGAFVALNETGQLTATNALYTVRFQPSLTLSDRLSICLGLLTSTARDQLRRRTRVYGGGLRKLEPSDLGSIWLPVGTGQPVSRRLYASAVAALLRGDEEKSRMLADTWFSRCRDEARMRPSRPAA